MNKLRPNHVQVKNRSLKIAINLKTSHEQIINKYSDQVAKKSWTSNEKRINKL